MESSNPIPVPDVIRSRVQALRWSTGAVIAALLVTAGAVLFLVAAVSQSVLIALYASGVMAAFIALLFLFADVFLTSATGAHRLDPGEFPWLEPVVVELAELAGVSSVPETLITDQASYNAYTIGRGRRAKVVFTRSLLEEVPRDEIRAIAAHEIGHVANGDVLVGVWSWAILAWVLFVGFLATVASFALFGMAGGAASTGDDAVGALVGWIIAACAAFIGAVLLIATIMWTGAAKIGSFMVTRQREFLADATAAAITGEPEVLVKALERISENAALSKGGSLVGSFCVMSPEIASHWWEGLFSTHPSPEQRIAELRKLPHQQIRLSEVAWETIGATGLFLPFGALVALLLGALIIPRL